jgi:hypothetical protein
MTRQQSRLIWAGLAAWILFAGAGSAQAQPACEDVCRYGVSCNTRCTMPSPAPGWEPTCGDAGFECGCDAWREVDRRPIGLLVNDCGLFRCKVSVLEAVTFANVCGQGTRQSCNEYTVAHCPHFFCPDEEGQQWCPF